MRLFFCGPAIEWQNHKKKALPSRQSPYHHAENDRSGTRKIHVDYPGEYVRADQTNSNTFN